MPYVPICSQSDNRDSVRLKIKQSFKKQPDMSSSCLLSADNVVNTNQARHCCTEEKDLMWKCKIVILCQTNTNAWGNSKEQHSGYTSSSARLSSSLHQKDVYLLLSFECFNVTFRANSSQIIYSAGISGWQHHLHSQHRFMLLILMFEKISMC